MTQSVAEGTLWAINNLWADCSNVALGETVCLPNQCTTYAMSSTDDCWSVSTNNNISYAAFLNYNPTINSDCSNLPPNGSVVCVTSPAGTYTPVFVPGTNQTAIGVYTDSAVPAPGPSAFGTTPNCGVWYQVQIADFCSRISISAQVSLDLFLLINPSIDAACDNLVPGLWYCTHPTFFWNETSSGNTTSPSTTLPAPAPTQSGTTKSCFAWHVIVSGDSCALLQETLGVTMTQLVAWNTGLEANCSNLILGDAYCVSGPPLASTTVTTSTGSKTSVSSTTSISSKASTTSKISTTSKTSTSSAPSSTTSSCGETYTVVSGDFCSEIWAKFDLTQAQFMALNPKLDANCDLQVGQVLCVSASAPVVCKKTYTVVSGDFCSKIWTANGLTQAQFLALNPNLDANCDLTVGEVLCIAD